uniref:TonB-dependent receptor n=1 Tax=Prevotella sp. GTC17254 TaxID=3236794 RepID=A0AB33J0R2_9BACT
MYMMTVASPVVGKATLSGQVTDAIDGSPLIGVVVTVPELNIGATTDEKGYYLFDNLPQRKLTVQVTYIGHRVIVEEINLATTRVRNFSMEETNAMINEVVVTGITGKALLKDMPTPVTLVSQRELQMAQSTNIINALAHHPGISEITTGNGISKPVIRGLGFNRVVVVNDGVRQEGQQWGDEHGVEVDPQTVSSVEILKGPASLMYGSDAMAGVLIFHDTPALAKGEMKANVSGEYQSNNSLRNYSLDIAGNQNDFVWNFRFSDKYAGEYKNRYDGKVKNSQYTEKGVNAMLGLNRSWGYSHLNLDYYYLKPSIVEGERDEVTGEFEDETPFQHVKHYKAVIDNTVYIGQGSLKSILGYQHNRRQEFEESPTDPGLDFMLHTINYDIHYEVPHLGGWRWNFGTNGMYQRSLNKGEEFLIPAYTLFDIGVFATGGLKINHWNISAGLRYDNRHLHSFGLDHVFEKISRNFSGLTGSVGATYSLGDIDVKLNIARGFRTPTVGELASNGVHEGTIQYVIGNKELKPEYSWQIDVGFDYTSKIVSTQLSLFASFIDNFIFNHKLNGVKTEGYDTYQYTQGNARLLGGEISIDFHPIRKLHFENTFSYVNAIQAHQPKESKYLPYTPAPRWTSELSYTFVNDGKVWDNTYAAVTMECNLRQNHFYAADDTETATPSYTLVNLSAGTDFKVRGKKVISLIFTLNNVFDRAYQNHLNRLKYAAVNNMTGRRGVFNMGRNFGVKLIVPLSL